APPAARVAAAHRPARAGGHRREQSGTPQLARARTIVRPGRRAVKPENDYNPRDERSAAMQPMTRRRFIGATGLAAVAPFGLTSGASGAQNRGSTGGAVPVEKNIVFGKGGRNYLHRDISQTPAD